MTTDPDHRYRKSSFCGHGACVEVAALPGGQIAMRDSKDPSTPVLRFNPTEWSAFVVGTKSGEFDLDLIPSQRMS